MEANQYMYNTIQTKIPTPRTAIPHPNFKKSE